MKALATFKHLKMHICALHMHIHSVSLTLESHKNEKLTKAVNFYKILLYSESWQATA